MNKKSYTIKEALEILLAPCSDSEMSDLDELDEEEAALQPSCDVDSDIDLMVEDNDAEKNKNTTNKQKVEFCKDSTMFEKYIPQWENKTPPVINADFLGQEFSLPPENFDTWTPYTYFKMFWKDELNKLISEQTNLYSVFKTSKSINTNTQEIQQFIGLQMLMSIVNLPSYNMYWANDTRYAPIADVINCILVEPEIEHSIDEQIIPAKTKYSGIHQYNPKKPVKWGFKNFVRSGSSGLIYDFFLYSGSVDNQKCTGSYVVHRLIETLPRNQNFRLYFDNWFASIPLFLSLKEKGFLAAATLRSDRAKGCPLPHEKDLKKIGRGSHSFQVDAKSGLAITKWYDSKCVQMITNYCKPQSVGKEYNKSMGGVDLSDMLIALYRTSIKTKRWDLKILFHCIDIAKVNAWLIYRRHSNQLKKPKKCQLSLLQFTVSIASALVKTNIIQKSVGRPSKRKSNVGLPIEQRKRPVHLPADDARFDSTNHFL
ncbi:piggyBac transposable element-derived protein 2 [Hydra vulgaris]|uniref:piggyBac transposable element-derived protein 2 n=1 Tax=Hydra vulgaris TaxID=6087 RepID=UPI001F5F8DB0|nr:piggyBac transposable element-derived protein 2-like [Hydra vulgaris]